MALFVTLLLLLPGDQLILDRDKLIGDRGLTDAAAAAAAALPFQDDDVLLAGAGANSNDDYQLSADGTLNQIANLKKVWSDAFHN